MKKRISSLALVFFIVLTFPSSILADNNEIAAQARYFAAPPRIDGYVDRAEWGEPVIRVEKGAPNISVLHSWEVPDVDSVQDLKGDVWIGWDENNLYFAAAVVYEHHLNPALIGVDLWMGSCWMIQIGGSANFDEGRNEIGFAYNPNGNRQLSHAWVGGIGSLGRYNRFVTPEEHFYVFRNEAAKTTYYEAAIPIGLISDEITTLTAGQHIPFSFAFAMSYDDPSHSIFISGFYEFGAGIINEKDIASAPLIELSADVHIPDFSAYPLINNDPLNLSTASWWARSGIAEALDKRFVPDDLRDNFQNNITRAEFCRLAVKWVEYALYKNIDAILAERNLSRNPDAFTDTQDPYILAAFALGITGGVGNNRFNPDGSFTREQAAGMIMNASRAIGADINNPVPAGFVDMHTASDWAVQGINFCAANGIMYGTGGSNFSPKTLYTREESIVTFNNIDPYALPKTSGFGA
jgi:hypothetical protein